MDDVIYTCCLLYQTLLCNSYKELLAFLQSGQFFVKDIIEINTDKMRCFV